MQQKFIKNIAYLVGLNLIIKPFWIFGIDRTVQNKLGEAEYGLYYALFNLGLLLNILLDLGINNYNNRSIAQEPDELKKRFQFIIGLKILLFVGYAIIVFGAAIILGYEGRALQWLLFLVINHGLLSFILYIRANLGGLLQFRSDRILSILDKSLMIVFAGILLLPPFYDYLSIGNFIYAQTAAYFLTLVVGFSFLRKKTALFPIKFSWAKSNEMLRKSMPFALLILLMAFYSRMDAVMIERLLSNGKMEAGIYAKGFRLLDAGNMIAYLFSVMLLPLFSKMLKAKEEVGVLVGTSVKTLLYPLLVLSVGFVTFKQPIFDFLYWSSTPYQARIFGLLILNLLPMGAVYIFGTLLTAGNKLKFLNYMALGGVALNLILNLFLIPIHHAEGAAIATLATQTLLAVIQVIAAVKYFPIQHTGIYFWRIISVIVLLILIGVLLTYMQFVNLLGLLIFLLIGFSLLFVFKALKFQTFLAFLNQSRNKL